MLASITRNLLAVFVAAALAQSTSFPVIGATYQLDRAKYPGQIAICYTQEAMSKYMTAKDKGDSATTKRMLFEIKSMKDFDKMKKAAGCTLISSYSQAKVVEKGVESHRAEFAAFPIPEPMWGWYLYFGGRMK
jgi:hypothetical protein